MFGTKFMRIMFFVNSSLFLLNAYLYHMHHNGVNVFGMAAGAIGAAVASPFFFHKG